MIITIQHWWQKQHQTVDNDNANRDDEDNDDVKSAVSVIVFYTSEVFDVTTVTCCTTVCS